MELSFFMGILSNHPLYKKGFYHGNKPSILGIPHLWKPPKIVMFDDTEWYRSIDRVDFG